MTLRQAAGYLKTNSIVLIPLSAFLVLVRISQQYSSSLAPLPFLHNIRLTKTLLPITLALLPVSFWIFPLLLYSCISELSPLLTSLDVHCIVDGCDPHPSLILLFLLHISPLFLYSFLVLLLSLLSSTTFYDISPELLCDSESAKHSDTLDVDVLSLPHTQSKKFSSLWQTTGNSKLNGGCPAQNMVFERANRACSEFGDRAVFNPVDTSNRNVFLEWGISDALFIDGKKIRTGPPPSYASIRKHIEKQIKKTYR